MVFELLSITVAASNLLVVRVFTCGYRNHISSRWKRNHSSRQRAEAAAPSRSAPLGLFRESGGERGPRPSGPDDLAFVTSCRPAVSGGNEKPERKITAFPAWEKNYGMRCTTD